MNKIFEEHIHKIINEGFRVDKRKLTEFREITIKTGVIKTADGSAIVKCGNTEVIAGVKLGIGTPFPDTPDAGVLMVGSELLPLSNPEFEMGPPDIDAIEIARVIDRGIRESKAIDEKKLCIVPGEKVWIVNVDVLPLNHDGNLIDIGSIAAIAALKDTKFPKLDKNGNIDYKEKTDIKLPIKHTPIEITVLKIGNNLLVDPTQDEEEVADARLTVASLEDGTLCALQKGGDLPLTVEEISKMIDLAIKKGDEIRKKVK